jgi:hypothetical protein
MVGFFSEAITGFVSFSLQEKIIKGSKRNNDVFFMIDIL